MIDGVEEWRPRRIDRRAGYGLAAFWLAFASLTAASSLFTGSSITTESWLKAVFGVFSGAVLTHQGLGYARARVVLTEQTLTVRSAWRTRWFLVDQVTDVRTTTAGTLFLLKDGQRIRSLVVSLNKRDRQSERPGAKRRVSLAREIQSAVLTAATRARTTRAGLILPPERHLRG